MNLLISAMTTAEKLDAMEQLWTSLQAQQDVPVPPEWHGQILAERQKRIDEGEITFSTLDDVRRRLEKRNS